MSDRDFEINGKKFKLNKIDALEQGHLVKRLVPLLGELSKVKVSETMSEEEKSIATVVPLMNGISRLSDADYDYVLFGLLCSVEVQQETGNWARVSTKSALMFQDMDLQTLLNIAGKAFMFNLSDFFAAAPRI